MSWWQNRERWTRCVGWLASHFTKWFFPVPCVWGHELYSQLWAWEDFIAMVDDWIGNSWAGPAAESVVPGLNPSGVRPTAGGFSCILESWGTGCTQLGRYKKYYFWAWSLLKLTLVLKQKPGSIIHFPSLIVVPFPCGIRTRDHWICYSRRWFPKINVLTYLSSLISSRKFLGLLTIYEVSEIVRSQDL
jgi:hypothetical protein